MQNKPHFSKTELNQVIDEAVNSGFVIDDTDHETVLNNSNYSWDDLNKLKDELGQSVLNFIGQVNSIITNPELIASLGDSKDHFSRLVNVFFTDINSFSGKIKALRVQHENQFGKVKNIHEFDHYNRLAIQYHALYSDLTTLITPTLSELVLTISDKVNAPVEQQV